MQTRSARKHRLSSPMRALAPLSPDGVDSLMHPKFASLRNIRYLREEDSEDSGGRTFASHFVFHWCP